MNLSNDYKNRQIIPRWYPFEYARSMGEINGTGTLIKSADTESLIYKLKEIEWEASYQLPLAVDFVTTALILNDFDNEKAKKAATYIISNKKFLSNLAIEATETFLRNGKQLSSLEFDLPATKNHVHIHNKIAHLKKCVRAYPVNPIPWADMAFYYSIINQIEKAHKCVTTALNLAHENRFVLRSIARFFLHIKEPDRALYHLRNAEITWRDPWLLATEISISEAFKLKPKTIREAKSIAASSDSSPRDLTELYGALGTLEANSGETKKAKRMFLSSLEDPNENAFAQAEWIASKIGLNVDRKFYPEIDALFEADARLYLRDGDFKKSFDGGSDW